MPILDIAAANAANQGIAIMTWPARLLKNAIIGFLKTVAYTLGGMLALCCFAVWVAYGFVLRLITGMPVEVPMTVRVGLGVFTFVYPLVGMWVIGAAWIMYRKHWHELQFGEGFIAAWVGAVYGVLMGWVLPFVLMKQFGDGFGAREGATLLTVATLAPLAISLWKQEKPKHIIPMAAFVLMEIVVFF